MEEVGTQVASPVAIHQTLQQRFFNPTHPMVKKRGFNFHSQSISPQNPSPDNWNPKSWDWDSARFAAKPVQTDESQVGNHMRPGHTGKDAENLRLLAEEPQQQVSRPNKRVRSGSPGSINHPMCQVDDCEEDLSTAKDYHRRHKVCEVHSKASKALVGKHMQRFCQQCSRFHPLSEFDEGKRSCRRRLAGHNRRRRKTQAEETTPRVLVPSSPQRNSNCDVNVFNLLTVLAHAQGNTGDNSGKSSSAPEKEHLLQILSKINSLPLPANIASKLPLPKNTSSSVPNHTSPKNQNQTTGDASRPSTMDLLAALSSEAQSQPSSEDSDSEKSRSAFVDPVNLSRGERIMHLDSPTDEIDGHNVRDTSPGLQLQLFSSSPEDNSSSKLPSGGNYLSSNSSNPSEERSRVSSSPPLMHNLFPMQPSRETVNARLSNSDDELACVKSRTSNGCSTSLQLFGGGLIQVNENGSLQSSPCGVGYTSSTGSDHSPSSLNYDSQFVLELLQLDSSSVKLELESSFDSSARFVCSPNFAPAYMESVEIADVIQYSKDDISKSSYGAKYRVVKFHDRTCRIIFKLFDKEPSQLPGSLRNQIYSWLSTSPSEMESYIRPGCIVLSLYLSMSSFTWNQLEENFLNYVESLVKNADVGFWGNGRFLVYTKRKMASHKDGKTRLCKSWKAWTTPELISVSPVAVVAGQETSLLLKGINLATPGTTIHCTHSSGYSVEKVASWCQATGQDEIRLSRFKISGAASNLLGRCFIEVENSCRSTTFPVIIADNTICQELKLLEPEINGTSAEVCGPNNPVQDSGRCWSRQEVLHFLNELGWLFQRKSTSSFFRSPRYRLSRFKYLLVFSVEHDFCALVKTLLDILVELNLGAKGLTLATESFAMLSEIHLLNRAVRKRCGTMVDLLVNYYVADFDGLSRKYIYPPNLAGPSGLTPLHLAACMSSSAAIVDALTNDPQAIGLHSWNSVLDANGLSPYAYASMRNNHSYNDLVARKLAEVENGQISVSITDEIKPIEVEPVSSNNFADISSQSPKSGGPCLRCAAACAYSKRFPGSNGLLQRPYLNSVLIIAAVCVCVCVFLRGHPFLRKSNLCSPFVWDHLGYGTS
ncbi:squamosa promoter-binding protein [Striga asiatica]|uniref:Squamosa promoter-binding protein n=1 Tax=Striga asiatica TaxID=4170 RepID=A0A5A7Q2D8_STRAF|nr:squamosa promoter-binding protein [Striga asiatica]